jgi:hypothetical protein
MIELYNAHRSLFITLGSILVLAASWINANLPRDASGYVKRPTSWPAFFGRMVIDLLALVPQPGKAGVFGPLNVPGLLSMNTPKPAAVEQPEKKPDEVKP